MALPLVPILAGGAGAGAGLGLGTILGDEDEQNREDDIVSKKDVNVDARQETFSPQITRAMNYSPNVQVQSPGATQKNTNDQRLRPQQSVTPEFRNPVTIPTQQETGGQAQGTDMENLLAIGLIGGGAIILGREVIK